MKEITYDEIKNILKTGDYISFDTSNNVLYKAKDVDTKNEYVFYYDEECGYDVWERFEYITSIFTMSEEIKILK